MGNKIANLFNRINYHFAVLTKGSYVTFAYSPYQANAVEEYMKTLDKDANNSSDLQKLSRSLCARLPQTIEELQTIERGQDTVLNGAEYASLDSRSTQRNLCNDLGNVTFHAGLILEKLYGVVSKDSIKTIRRLIGINDNPAEETAQPNRLTTFKEAVQKSPDFFDKEQQTTVFKAIDAIEELARGQTPSRENLESIPFLNKVIHYFASQWRDKTPETKEIIEAAGALNVSGCSSTTTLDYLLESTIDRLLKFHKKQEMVKGFSPEETHFPFIPM